VDAVFTSEDYGAELARRLGAAAVTLDLARSWMPVSGTAVRGAPAEHWHLLPAGTRAALARRVVVLGAESTGTTTLAEELGAALRARGGAHVRTRVVPEYGRAHTLVKLAVVRAEARREGAPEPWLDAVEWTEADFLHIARKQAAWEEAAARDGGPVLVLDTDALATGVWHERYRGSVSRDVQAVAAALPRRDLYVLTGHDGVPFVQDGLRDGEAVRTAMTGRFAEVLAGGRTAWIRVDGSVAARVARVLAALDGLPALPA
jgi:NadR type nicotinamide-nucleotide adenylyltransferase